MTSTDKIMEILAYRLNSVRMMRYAIDLRTRWINAPNIAVEIDGKLAIEGNLNAITGPMMDGGIIHCRALIEFLGIKLETGALAQRKGKRREKDDDIGIEMFSPLRLLTPEDIMASHSGDFGEAGAALIYVLRVASKGLAHTTSTLLSDKPGKKNLLIASKLVEDTMTQHFYGRLDRPAPQSWVATTPMVTRE